MTMNPSFRPWGRPATRGDLPLLGELFSAQGWMSRLLSVGETAVDLRERIALLEEELARETALARTDSLTGLANRRGLAPAAEQAWRLCAREGRPLAMLLVDADYFKQFNDHFGHVAGDDCLRILAALAHAVASRPGDVAARYGGEEFLLLLPNTDGVGAQHVAERMRSAVVGARLPHPQNLIHGGVVTVSIGAATTWPQPNQLVAASVSAIVEQADQALYEAKSSGRNRVNVKDG